MMKWKKDPTKEIMMIWTKETDDGASQRCRAVTQRASEMELIRLRLTAIGPGRGGKVTCTFYMLHLLEIIKLTAIGPAQLFGVRVFWN